MEVTGVHHVAINVADVPTAIAFYVDVVGLSVLDRPEFGLAGAWLAAPDGRQVHLVERPGEVPPEGQHFAFAVHDAEAAAASLRTDGVTVSPVSALPNGSRQFFVKDPAGNLIEFNQPR